jgi:hypothetical protein
MTQGQMIFGLDLRQDQMMAKLTLGPASAELSSNQVDQFIAALAGIRSQMMPPVPEDFPQPTHQHSSTKFVLGISAVTGELLLSFRSPAFGWLSFGLSFEAAEMLANQMLASKDHPLAADMSKPN